MLFPSPKPKPTLLSVLLSSPKVYKTIIIGLSLCLSFYLVSSFWNLEVNAPDWQRYNGDANTSEQEGPIDADRRFALIVPSTKSSPNLCKNIFSTLALGYPSPVIINWGVNYWDISHWRFGKSLPKIIGMVDYLDSVMHPNATTSEKLEEDDIVLMVDAFDVWFQLPPQVLLSRYHEINRRANERLRKQWKRRDKPMPMKQTIVVAAEKKCYPNDPELYGVDLKCDIWPESPLRSDLYGPETDKNYTLFHNNRPRWVNGGMYIGPAGDMRRMFRRAKQRIEAMVGEAFPIRSEQGMIGQIIGEQEVWRQLQRNNHVNVELEELIGENLEFHVGVDYGQEISAQTSATDISEENDIFDGDFVYLSDQEDLDLHSDVRGISPGRVNGVPDDLKSVQSPLFEHGKAVDWGDMPLFTDFFLSSVPVMMHYHKFKDRRRIWWDRPWYHGHLRGLVKSALLPREADEPLATVQLGQGRIRYWAASAEAIDRYPRMGLINSNTTAYERFPSMSLNETCQYDGGKVIHGHKSTWEEEVFRDGGAMRFYASFSLAFGLAAASPCKPLTSATVSEVLSSSITADISSTLIESASSTVDSSVTTIETGAVTETSTATSTEFTEVSISTTESLSEPTSDATTSATATSALATTALSTETSSVETSTALTATITSEEAGPTGHLLIAGPGPALGGSLKSNKDIFTPLLFGDRQTFSPVRFEFDESTGRLQQDGVPVCAYYQSGLPYAMVTLCNSANIDYGSTYLNCASPLVPGTALSCSAWKLDCWPTGPGSAQRCTRAIDPDWGQFFISIEGDNIWYLSSSDLDRDFLTTVEVFVDYVPATNTQLP
ncbi:hypothetical protein IL306_010345 [Fusarium sp. DS 682]|nr:hypothetical protein IL306_010345 [Fusarium sp. DS 682]